MRAGAAIALLHQAVAKVRSGGSIETVALAVVCAAAGLLLLAGLWTPIAAALVATIEFWNAFAESGDLWLHIVLAVLAASLALIGPGAWSVDARLFGWKRIDIRTQDRQDQGPRP